MDAETRVALLTELEEAVARLERSRRYIRTQRQRIAEGKREGDDVSLFGSFLANLEHAQQLHQENHDRILRLLNE